MGFLDIVEIASNRRYNTFDGPEMRESGIFTKWNISTSVLKRPADSWKLNKMDGNYILRYKYFALENSRANAGIMAL